MKKRFAIITAGLAAGLLRTRTCRLGLETPTESQAASCSAEGSYRNLVGSISTFVMAIIFSSIFIMFLCQRGQASPLFNARWDFPAGDGPRSVAMGDLDGDGVLDLAVANAEYSGDNLSVILGNGDGTLKSAVNYAAGVWPTSVAIGDLDGDGTPDLAVANYYSNNVSVLCGNGDGTFKGAANYGTTNNMPRSITTGDFDGGGTLDLAVANNYPGNVSVFINRGSENIRDNNSVSSLCFIGVLL